MSKLIMVAMVFFCSTAVLAQGTAKERYLAKKRAAAVQDSIAKAKALEKENPTIIPEESTALPDSTVNQDSIARQDSIAAAEKHRAMAIQDSIARQRTIARERDKAREDSIFTALAAVKLEMRVIDVGHGQCVVIKLPNNKYIIYDAGAEKDKGQSAMKGITKFIPRGSDIEMLILSHDDEYHIGAADSILYEYNVQEVWHTGYGVFNPKKDSTKARKGFAEALWKTKTEEICLAKEGRDIKPGEEHNIGDVKIQFLAGFQKPLEEWKIDPKNKHDLINSTSIVMRLEFAGKAILLTGDALGWHYELPEDTVIATEAFMLEHTPELLKCDVLIASDGGSLHGSSYPFARAAKPKYVIFSSGKDDLPRWITVDRFVYFGAEQKNMFRTDRGDGYDEYPKPNTKPKEWTQGAIEKCIDKTNDDDVRVVITGNGSVQVGYVKMRDPCKN